jgi:hypothetical protein
MNKEEKKTNISEKVMSEIKEKHIHMRSKLYFVLGSLVLGIGMTGALLTALFFIAILSFRLRVYGSLGFLWFGQFGLRPFLMTFPWIPLIIGIAGIAGGVALLKRYEFSYKRSFISIAIVVIAIVLSLGFFLDQFVFDERVNTAPIGRILHAPKQIAGDNWVLGEVQEAREKEMDILTPDEKEVLIQWDEESLLLFGGVFEEGQRVRVVGEWDGDVFKAQGIGKGGMKWRSGDLRVKGRMMQRRDPRMK